MTFKAEFHRNSRKPDRYYATARGATCLGKISATSHLGNVAGDTFCNGTAQRPATARSRIYKMTAILNILYAIAWILI
jgi:hypothetical protein